MFLTVSCSSGIEQPVISSSGGGWILRPCYRRHKAEKWGSLLLGKRGEEGGRHTRTRREEVGTRSDIHHKTMS